jgi:hypothetical protein
MLASVLLFNPTCPHSGSLRGQLGSLALLEQCRIVRLPLYQPLRKKASARGRRIVHFCHGVAPDHRAAALSYILRGRRLWAPYGGELDRPTPGRNALNRVGGSRSPTPKKLRFAAPPQRRFG